MPGLSSENSLSFMNLLWFGGYGLGSMLSGVIVDPTDAHSMHVLFSVLGVVLLLFIPTFLRLTNQRISTRSDLSVI